MIFHLFYFLLPKCIGQILWLQKKRKSFSIIKYIDISSWNDWSWSWYDKYLWIFLVIMLAKISFRLLNTYFSHKLCFEIRQPIMVNISDYYLSSPYEDIVKQKQGALINNIDRWFINMIIRILWEKKLFFIEKQ